VQELREALSGVLPLVDSGSIQSSVNHTLTWPRVGLDHSKPRTAVKEWSTLAPSASSRVCAQRASVMPSRPPHAPSRHGPSTWPSALLTVEWSVSAAASTPAARIEANARAGSPSPSL
jgi:hypothetical protein